MASDTEAMTDGNVASVQAMYDAYARQDIPAILTYLDENVQWEVLPENCTSSVQEAGVPWLMPFKGRDNVMGFFKALAEHLDIKTFKPQCIVGNGNIVFSKCFVDTDTKAGGHMTLEEVHYWEFNDKGKVAFLRHFHDTHKIIRAWKGEKT